MGLVILIVTVTINGSKDRDGGGSSSGDNGNDRNSRNSEGSSRNGANWEVEEIKGMDSEGMMFDGSRTGNGSDCEQYLI
jgi:hypothetical protein